MRSRRVSLTVVVLVSALGVSLLAGGVFGTPTPTATNGTATHTLVITGTGSYTATASGTLQLANGESSDYRLRGSRVTGTVGEQGDTKDVITYTGYIESFQADGQVQVTLDGQQIAPTVLAGQHIRISRSGTSSQPILYQFFVTERASHGELAENDDTVSKTRVRGRIRDQADSFYFTGDIKNSSISVTGPATVLINGQNATVFLTHEPPTPTPTATPAPPTNTPPTRQSTPTATPTSTPTTQTPSPTPTTHRPTRNDRTGSGAPGASFFNQLIHNYGWVLVLIALGLVTVLYLRSE